MKIPCLLLIAAAAILTGCGKPQASSGPQPEVDPSPSSSPAFSRDVYRTLEGARAITIISSDELEIAERGMNLVCKYSKEGDTFRVIINSMGTTQAVYFRRLPNGLEDATGQIFYTSEGLEVVKEAARVAQLKAEEDARFQELERQRVDKLTEASKQATKTIATFNCSRAGRSVEDNSSKVVIYDVKIDLGPDHFGNTDVPWFGEILRIARTEYEANFSDGVHKYIHLEIWNQLSNGNSVGSGVYFRDFSDCEQFVSTLDKAIREWRKQHPDVPMVEYTGLTSKSQPLSEQATSHALPDQAQMDDLECADKEINDVYQKLLATLSSEKQRRLREAQRAWLKFRDASADRIAKDGGAAGGSAYRVDFSNAAAKLTRQRTEVLRGYLSKPNDIP